MEKSRHDWRLTDMTGHGCSPSIARQARREEACAPPVRSASSVSANRCPAGGGSAGAVAANGASGEVRRPANIFSVPKAPLTYLRCMTGRRPSIRYVPTMRICYKKVLVTLRRSPCEK